MAPMSPARFTCLFLALAVCAPSVSVAQPARHPPLAAADVEAITQLVKLEDTRQFDEAVLARLIKARHPEVRRRAVVSIGRIVNPRGCALRLTALTPLAALAPDAAKPAATALAGETSVVAKGAAAQVLVRLEGSRPASPAGPRPPLTPPPAHPDEEYRRIVERWIVPDYKGAPKPRVILETPRGSIEIELYPGDAPLGLAYLVRVVESGEIVGTEFGRVVPNFVDQQRAIRDNVTLRDEVNRRGLTHGNLSWASGGLDTGRPGYTLGSTPQPHNEGDFTSLGRVVRGMDVVDRIELGDKITGARMVR
jgi:cyclophilin family peptidyl-prolyl cis-trans isomerase